MDSFTGRFLYILVECAVGARHTSCVVTREDDFFTNREFILVNVSCESSLHLFSGFIALYIFLFF